MKNSKLVRAIQFFGGVLFVMIFVPNISKIRDFVDPSSPWHYIYYIGLLGFAIIYFVGLGDFLPYILGSKRENNNKDS